jgi:hypothetical protein
MNTIDTKKPKGDRLYPEHDFKTLLAAIGSDKDVATLIRDYGYEAPPLASIRGWRSRNSIPSRWVPLLVGWAMQKGVMKTPETLIRSPF